MNRRDFVKNSFLAAIATALSGPLKIAAEASAFEITMDTSMIFNGDIVYTSALIPNSIRNVAFLITKSKNEVFATRLDQPEIRIKINSIDVIHQGRHEPPDDEFSHYYERSAPPLLRMNDISSDPVVVAATSFGENGKLLFFSKNS